MHFILFMLISILSPEGADPRMRCGRTPGAGVTGRFSLSSLQAEVDTCVGNQNAECDVRGHIPKWSPQIPSPRLYGVLISSRTLTLTNFFFFLIFNPFFYFEKRLFWRFRFGCTKERQPATGGRETKVNDPPACYLCS